jgi:cytidylate kinase
VNSNDAGVPRGTRRAIAVDGLSGAGKSTVSRRVAAHLGWAYLDTGACYRALTLAVLRAGLLREGASSADGPLAAVATRALAELELSTDPETSCVRLGAEDVTAEIRSVGVTDSVSAVAADPGVRRAAVAWQRARISGAAGAVVEGRDIGSVVLPDALLKIWLTASADRRAGRRASEQAAVPGTTTARTTGSTRVSLERRDRLDSTRSTDPARQADDAVVIDTDSLDIDEVVERVLELAAARGLAAVS